jgi:hypothetical protein
MYCTMWNDTEASVGWLSDDLSTYTEIWNSTSEPIFALPGLGNPRYRTTGISEAPAGDIWVGFTGLSAIVRFSTSASIFASFSTNNDYPGTKWTPGAIVAYSVSPQATAWGPMHRLMCADAQRNILVAYDQVDLQLLKFSPDVSLP